MMAVAVKNWLNQWRDRTANRLSTLSFSPSHEFHQRLEPHYRRIIYRLIRAVYRPDYIGFEQLPESGPAIIICNHVSYMDGPIISAGCKRHVRFLIDEAIFHWPGVHYFMTLDRAIPIAPRRDSVEKAFHEIEEALKAGELVCLFPEGQLTYTGSLSRFKPGIEFIIRHTPVPVYPMALTGLWGSIFSRKYARSFLPFLPRSLKRLRIRAICGAAISPQDVTISRLQQEVLRLKYSGRP